MVRTVVRGDSLDFEVSNVIGGIITSTAGWDPSIEFRRHPADSMPLASLSIGNGIVVNANSNGWVVGVTESATASFAPPGRQGRVYYQLRIRDDSPGSTHTVTVETGEIFVERDFTRVSDGFAGASGASDGGTF